MARFALGGERVGRLAGLADRDDQAVLVDDRIAIAELAAVVHLDRNLRQPLDHEFPGERRVPARAAGDDLHVAEIAEFLLGDVHLVEEHFAGFLRDPAEQRVADGARLLEDFLLHEMLEAALFRHDRIPGDVLGRARDRVAFEIAELHALRREHGHFAVAEEENAARVREDRRDVARDEKLVVAEADDDRRPQARRDDFVRVLRGDGHQGVGAGHRLHGFAHGFFERRVFREFLDQVGDDFRVGFGDELVALGRSSVFLSSM